MKYTATVDKKYTKWDRMTIEFEAKNEAKANDLLKKWDGMPPDADILDTEIIYETDEVGWFSRSKAAHFR
jgi:hypothetical protein